MEWFKTLLKKYPQHQIVIFDPYFENAGLGLVSLYAVEQSDYIVFTSLPKVSKTETDIQNESDQGLSGRINNLMASCEHNSHLLKCIKLRIYGLKEGKLHDRYILIMGSDNLPVAGFHLSNSLQKAAENYPLLITPIPTDVLLQVEQYKCALVQEAIATQVGSEEKTSAIRLLFSSKELTVRPQRYEPLSFLEKSHSGNVISMWAGDLSLKGLRGGSLRKHMVLSNLLEGSSLRLPHTGLHRFLEEHDWDFRDFTATWDILGDVFAHSHMGEDMFHEFQYKGDFLISLCRFLEVSFSRLPDTTDQEFSMVGIDFFRKSVEDFLYSPYLIDHLYHPIKYKALTWAEYYAIKILWCHAPDCLLMLTEAQISNLLLESSETDIMRLSLLSQIVSEISLSIQFDISEAQRERLIHSRQGLLQWMGLNVIKQRLDKPDGLTSVLMMLKSFSHVERVRILGWMIHRVVKHPNKKDIYKGLVAALHETLPEKISEEELQHVVNSMLGHMRRIALTEPWLFQDVIYPLLVGERITYEYACNIWFKELTVLLAPQLHQQSRLFELAHEGQTTNIVAFLFAYSDSEQQEASLKVIRKILKCQQRIVQQPLASTSNWSQWNDALKVSLWILAFSRWGEFYVRQRNMTNDDLVQLSCDARELAMIRPMKEWRSKNAVKHNEIIFLLDNAEKYLGTED